MLYERNYKVLTDDEQKDWDKVEKKYGPNKSNGISVRNLYNYWKLLPKPVISIIRARNYAS